MIVPVISIVGYSGSGKTYLIGEIVRGLSLNGFLITAVKNSHHKRLKSPLDKDSEMIYKEGAQTVMAVSDEDLIIQVKQVERPKFDNLVTYLDRSVDFVICEGFKDSGLPKIWVGSEIPTDDSIQNLVATVDNEQPGLDTKISRFSSKNLDQIAYFIVSNFVIRNAPVTREQS